MKIYPIRMALILFVVVASISLSAFAQIQFDRPKTEPPLDNPYTMSIPREQILEATNEILKKCGIGVDGEKSKPSEGKIFTRAVIFSRGVTTRNDLEYLAIMPASEVRNWVQGRFHLEISALPLDQKRSQLFVAAHIEGRMADAMQGSKWVEGQSNGRLEDEILRGLASKILGVDLSIKKGSNPRRILNCEY